VLGQEADVEMIDDPEGPGIDHVHVLLLLLGT